MHTTFVSRRALLLAVSFVAGAASLGSAHPAAAQEPLKIGIDGGIDPPGAAAAI